MFRTALIAVAFVMLLVACGEAAEESAVVDESDAVEEIEQVEEVEQVEQVEEVVEEASPVVLPEPWPADFVLPANMIIAEETTDENGNAVIIANYPDGVERLNIWDLSDYFSEGPLLENWSILEIDGFNYHCSDMEFYCGLTSDQGNILCDGFWGTGNLLSVKLTWERPL